MNNLYTDDVINEQEYAAYMKDFKKLVKSVIKKIVTMADNHNVDRDNAMQHFSTIFFNMVKVSSFEHFGENKQVLKRSMEEK